MTLREYVNKKFNYRKSITGCLGYMLRVSFFSVTFREFWNHWNPLWGYYLRFYVYRPIREIISKPLAMIGTFAISGFLHDVFVMVLLQKTYFLFSLIFLFFGITILIELILNINLEKANNNIRPFYHLGIIASCAIAGINIYS